MTEEVPLRPFLLSLRALRLLSFCPPIFLCHSDPDSECNEEEGEESPLRSAQSFGSPGQAPRGNLGGAGDCGACSE